MAAKEKRLDLNKLLHSVSSGIHIACQTIPRVERYNFYSAPTLCEFMDGLFTPEQNKKRPSRKKATIKACTDLTDLEIFSKGTKKELEKQGFVLPKDGSRFIFYEKQFDRSSAYFLFAMFALSFEQKHGVSTYSLLGTYNGVREKKHNLADWALLMKRMYDLCSGSKEVTFDMVSQGSKLPKPTALRRIDWFEEEGYIRKDNPGRHANYKVGDKFYKEIRNDTHSFILRKIKNLMREGKVTRKDLAVVNAPSLTKTLDYKFGVKGVERMLTKLKKKKAITPIEGVVGPQNDTLLRLTETGTSILTDFFIPIVEAYKTQDMRRIVEGGVRQYVDDNRRMDGPKFRESLRNSLVLYNQANQNRH